MNSHPQIVKILFLAANPNGTERRRLDEEIRRIELALERAKRREQFKIIQKWAVTDDDLRRALLDHEPEVVHFSGHGGGSQGLAFVDSQGRLLVISGDSLARLFEQFADHLRCVILNACFSEVQAKVISRHIEIVVGMSQDIGEEASIKFSEGFYDALGAGRDFEKAYKFGCIAIDLQSLQEHLVPIILRNPEIRRHACVSAQGDGPIRIVPRGLHSFQTEDSDFFLELLPGPYGHDGLPTSLRFWKTRIEERNPDRTFPVGLIYGPSGCGKSSLVKAGLLPRLSDTIQPVLVEATADDTETRLLKGLRGAFPGLGSDLNLIDTFIKLRRESEATGRKTLIVLDQFEQWLHAKTEEERSELALALRLCDGANIQCVVMIRDDFWVSNKRFMNDVGVPISDGENAALVDLFDVRHARKVLGLFADAYGVWENSLVEPTERAQFLDDAVSGLAEDDRVICVRIALFCELFQGKPWDLKTLEKVGGVEGVGILFVEETFSADNAPAENRYHQKAVRAVLNALLPEPGSKIKGRMRSDRELMDVSGYAQRPDDFQALVRILDEKTHLITPTDPEGLGADEGGVKKPSVGRFYQLTHDYLVQSIREWLTRKQKETRRGRAELLLADRSSLWNAKPENRHLPSVWEWANINLLTRKKDWNEPQRRMMNRAGRLLGLRTLGVVAGLVTLVLLGLDIRRRVVEANREAVATGLVDQVVRANIAQVPNIVRSMGGYRRWVDPALRQVIERSSERSPERLHAGLALLPVDDGQVEYLFQRLQDATADEVPVLRDALEPHQTGLTPKLWSVLDSAKPGDPSLLPAASSLALYNPQSPRWNEVGAKVAEELVTTNLVYLRAWVDALRPVRTSLTAPLATVFRDKKRPETERTLATSILADYASGDPNLVANLLMDAQPKAYASLFPIAQRLETKTLPLFQDEIARTLAPTWNDPPLDPSWTTPHPTLTAKIESAQGMLAERFAFCQTMPLEEFVGFAEALRPSGYRPTRFRPYAEGKSLGVAAVWTRDGRPWRLAHDQSTDEIRQTDERNRKAGYLPVDVAGYLAASGDEGKPTSRFTALWALRTRPDDDARMVLASSVAELTKIQEGLKSAGFAPIALHSWRQADEKLSYSGVWHKTATGTTDTGSFQSGLSEANLPGVVAQQAGSLIDLDLAAAPPPPSTKERAASALQAAEAALKAKPDDLNARFNRATAYFQLGESQKAIDDLNAVIEKLPLAIFAYQSRAIAHARLGHKQQAQADLQFQKGVFPRWELPTAVMVAAELGQGTNETLERLEASLKKQPQDSRLYYYYYYAACAYSVASQAVARSDQARSKSLSERALSLLRKAIENGYADYKQMQEDADLDPIRDLPAFIEIMKVGHLDRSYAAVWMGDYRFEANLMFGLDPIAHLHRCRELVAQGYRMVALSVARTSPEAPPITASVWHRPVITEETRDQLAEHQARAAIALLRMDKAEEVWPLLRHSADPRLRSFIVNWLSPLGADTRIIAAELERLPATAQPSPVQGQQKMDAILFHPETSQRRALILALGTYGTEGLSPGEREPLTGKLFDLYRNDPDAGIHGAVEWTLRQWKQQEKLQAADAKLMKLKDWGDRRWYVNGQGQTFAVIEGPVEFRMGSPPTEPERIAGSETPRRTAIPRRFAIAAKEVTVEQFQRFLKLGGITIDRYQVWADLLSRYSPDPQGPWIAPDWYTAAHYCNWLSEQEGLSKDQWCYLPIPIEVGAYAEGMSIPANVLQRTGYRLPTEAEWEFACRAGAVTSRYYGHSLDLLDAYARHQANSKEHAWTCGSLFPNDLGLFDMLGNMVEWCQDSSNASKPAKKGIYNDSINISESIFEQSPRILRGGSFRIQPADVRSADRNGLAPTYRGNYIGFRPSRTYH